MATAVERYAIKASLALAAHEVNEATFMLSMVDRLGAQDGVELMGRVQSVIERAVALRADLREAEVARLDRERVPVVHDEGPTNA